MVLIKNSGSLIGDFRQEIHVTSFSLRTASDVTKNPQHVAAVLVMDPLKKVTRSLIWKIALQGTECHETCRQ